MAHFKDVRQLHLLDVTKWTPALHTYYCLHCIDVSPNGSGWGNAQVVGSHIQATHGVEIGDQGAGRDYCTGLQLRHVLLRRGAEIEEQVLRFHRRLEALFSADDFVTDCGLRAPDDPWWPPEAPA